MAAKITLPTPFTTKDGRAGVLRRLTEDDAAEICCIFPLTHAESDFLNYLPGEFDLTLEQEKQFIRDRSANSNCLLVCAEIDQCIIGLGGAEQTKFRRYHHHCEMGVTIFKKYWGQGIGRVITNHIINWSRQQGLRKLYLKVFSDNDRALALYRSVGFTQEGRLIEDALRADGSFGDVIIMSLFFKENR